MQNPELTEIAQGRVGDFKKLQAEGLIPLSGQFFPSVHYPPITMYPPIDEATLFSGYKNPPGNLFDIYVHIPFCIRYCNFCHYPNIIGATLQEKDRYLQALDQEMDIYLRRLGIKQVKARSILVGGGTPTHLAPAQLERFLQTFTAKIDRASHLQFNYDVDPSTLLGKDGEERLRILKAHGVNRLTIGIQSLNDSILSKMNRAHTRSEALESIKQAKANGFQLCIELIYGYCGETLESWLSTIRTAVTLEAEEIQLYHVKTIPYGDHSGPISQHFKERRDDFPSLEEVVMMKGIAQTLLAEQGYHENLTRVFTKKPEDFSHYASNQCCFLLDEIGLGLTAFSSLRDRFGLNTQNMEDYYAALSRDSLPLNRGLVRTKDDQMRWHVILPLKNRRVYKNLYQKGTGDSLDRVFRKKIERLKGSGLLCEDDKMIALTPLGRFFADAVCIQFHHPRYMPLPRSAYSNGPLNPYNDPEP
ncbi:MAG: coproporphyrinogen-III oxidase family protein [Candidatus Omnitrophota bacterium]